VENVCVIGEATNGQEAVAMAKELRPALILMDIGMPIMDGIKATELIKESCKSKIVLVTSHDNEDDVMAGLSAGADAYCLKDISAFRLGNAINAVLEGAVWLDPDIAKTLMQAISFSPQIAKSTETSRPSDPQPGFQLSERETSVLRLLVDGLSNQQIGERLGISSETVKTHMRHLMDKLKVSDRTQAAVKAVREGLIQ
jgi:DNA-binding NarL/FixJ family response regulator